MHAHALRDITLHLAASLDFIMGVLVLWKKPKSSRYIAFFLLAVAVGLWTLEVDYFLIVKSTDAALFWIHAVAITITLIAVTFYHLVHTFKYDNIHQYKYKILIAYVLSVCVGVGYFIPNFYIKNILIHPWGKENILGPGYYVVYFIYGLYLILGFKNLIIAAKRGDSPKQNQVKYLIYSTIFAFIWGSYFNWVLVLFGNYKYIWVGPYSSFIWIAATFYSIIKHRLLDINIIAKKTTIYTLLSACIVGIYVTIILVFETLFQKFTGYTSLLVRILAGFIIAVSFQPLRNRIELIMDKIFFRTKYDYQKTLLNFSQSLSAILDLRMLLDLLIKVTTSTLKIKKASVMLYNKTTEAYFITSQVGLPATCRNWKFNMESKLISWLINEKKIAVRSNFYKKPLSILDFHIISEMRLLRSAVSIPLIYKQEIIGILNIGEKLSGEDYSAQDLELLDTLGSESAIAISNANLYNSLEKNYLQTIQALAQAIEAKDRSTRGHSERVTKLAIEIARELNINRENIEILQYASILHDIGKIAVEEEILNKPGKLTEAEYERIKIHPVKGEEIIGPITFLDNVKPIIRHHHERFDGKGYPDQMKGNEIPLLARILSVADVFDALVSDRPYRVFRMSHEEALAEIQKCSGTQFDPEIVQTLTQMFQSNKINLS